MLSFFFIFDIMYKELGDIMENEKIGIFIKDIRTKNKLTQKEFAELFGVTYQAVSKWENGKNLPDINILKDICKKYEISLDEVLNGEEKTKKTKNLVKIVVIVISLIILILGSILIFSNFTKEKDFEFKTLSSTCENFKVSGSIAYNDKKSSIYISNVNYCGSDNENKYKVLNCILYEVDDEVKKEVSKHSHTGEGITLDEFLSNVTFNIDNYDKLCDTYQENSFVLEVDAIDDNGEIFSHKIPLVLEENCTNN